MPGTHTHTYNSLSLTVHIHTHTSRQRCIQKLPSFRPKGGGYYNHFATLFYTEIGIYEAGILCCQPRASSTLVFFTPNQPRTRPLRTPFCHTYPLIGGIRTIRISITDPALGNAGAIGAGVLRDSVAWHHGAVALIAAVAAVVVVIAHPALLNATAVAAGEFIGAARLVCNTMG